MILCGIFYLCGCSVVKQTTGIQIGSSNITVEVTIEADQDINRDLNNQPAPVLVRLFFLSGRSNFDNASYEALFSQRDGGIAGELVVVRDVLILPGSKQQIKLEQTPAVSFIGVTAGYRELDSIKWRDITAAREPLFWRKTGLKISVSAQSVRILE